EIPVWIVVKKLIKRSGGGGRDTGTRQMIGVVITYDGRSALPVDGREEGIADIYALGMSRTSHFIAFRGEVGCESQGNKLRAQAFRIIGIGRRAGSRHRLVHLVLIVPAEGGRP